MAECLKIESVDNHDCGSNVENHQLARAEIEDMLKSVMVTSSQPCRAQVWVPPCTPCGDDDDVMSCMKRAVFEVDKLQFSKSYDWKMCKSHKVQDRELILSVNLAPKNINESTLCPKLRYFNIIEWTLANYEMETSFGVSFAICLKSSSLTGSGIYVVEFFLDQDMRNHEKLCSFLYFVLPLMKEKLKSFEVASGKELGEYSVLEVIEYDKDDQLSFFGLCKPVGFRLEAIHDENENTYYDELEADVVDVMLWFGGEVVEFELPLRSGIKKLGREVVKRFKCLKTRTFNLKYLNEDDDEWILLACDDDLKDCIMKTMLHKPRGTSKEIRMSVHL